VFEVADQPSVGLVETSVTPFEGEGPEGVPGVGQGAVVKLQTGLAVLPQIFFATIFQ
jgi:hypothetical protein